MAEQALGAPIEVHVLRPCTATIVAEHGRSSFFYGQ